MSFKMIAHAIKSRHEDVKMTNPTRAHPVAVIDANLIGYKSPNGMEAEKYVELLPTIFIFSRSYFGIKFCRANLYHKNTRM